MADVIADVIGILQGQHHEVVALAVAHGAGGGGLGFLVRGFAVDDGGHVVLGVLPDALPDAHHVAAGGVDDLAADLLDAGQRGHIRAEGGHDDDIRRGEIVHRGLRVLADEVLDAEGANLLIDLGVVNDLAEDEEAAVREDLGRGVGEVDGALDAVAKAELLREFHRDVPRRERAAFRAQLFHHLAAVVGLPPAPARPP